MHDPAQRSQEACGLLHAASVHVYAGTIPVERLWANYVDFSQMLQTAMALVPCLCPVVTRQAMGSRGIATKLAARHTQKRLTSAPRQATAYVLKVKY